MGAVHRPFSRQRPMERCSAVVSVLVLLAFVAVAHAAVSATPLSDGQVYSRSLEANEIAYFSWAAMGSADTDVIVTASACSGLIATYVRNCPSGFANCSEPTAASNDVATLSFENDNRTQPELRPVVCNSGFTPTCPSNMGYLIGVQALAPATTIEIVAVTVSTSQPLKIWTNELYVNIDAPSKGQAPMSVSFDWDPMAYCNTTLQAIASCNHATPIPEPDVSYTVCYGDFNASMGQINVGTMCGCSGASNTQIIASASIMIDFSGSLDNVINVFGQALDGSNITYYADEVNLKNATSSSSSSSSSSTSGKHHNHSPSGGAIFGYVVLGLCGGSCLLAVIAALVAAFIWSAGRAGSKDEYAPLKGGSSDSEARVNP